MIQDDPKDIMDKFDFMFRELFLSEEYATNDRMEPSIVSVNKITNQVMFCGSKMHMIIQTQSKISLIKGSKKGIGENYRKAHEFENVILDLEKGDRFYLLSDGLQNQFWGANLEN